MLSTNSPRFYLSLSSWKNFPEKKWPVFSKILLYTKINMMEFEDEWFVLSVFILLLSPKIWEFDSVIKMNLALLESWRTLFLTQFSFLGFYWSTTDASFKQSLPGKVRSPAVFRCHRVTAISNDEAEFVYQATVRISGHVFKGFLYDQGVDEKNAFPCISPLHLEGNTISRRNGNSSSPIVAPSNAYQATASWSFAFCKVWS